MSLVRFGLIGLLLGAVTPVLAQDCPRMNGRSRLALERPDASTEVSLRQPLVVAETKFRNGSSVKATYYQGLVELDRVQRDRVFVFKPKSPLDTFFPIKPNAVLRFEAEHGEEGQQLRKATVELAVVGARKFSIGNCTNTVWLIERRVPGSGSEMRVTETYYYSDEFKSILAREYPENGGRRDIISYTRMSQQPGD